MVKMATPFDAEATTERLTGARLRGPVIYLDSTGSTNDDLRQLALEGAAEGTVVMAGVQTAGRGRRGREWHGEAGRTLMFSVLLRPGMPAERWPALGPLTGAAVAVACAELSGADVGTKWPNDVVYAGCKLAGLLLEAQAPHFAVIGVGINVQGDEESLPAELRGWATTLELVCGKRIAPQELLVAVLNALDERYGLLLEEQSAGLLAEQRRLESTLGKQVVASVGRSVVEGVAHDVTGRGELIVLTAGGEVVVSSGEVQSVRDRNGDLPA